ncbi:hypothetical protein C8255_23220 [filamentous cyanobacterium CCP3]|nr:hypothetical protein C8255_23220 [filamentous cyanobacterium CCP3]
MPYISLVQGESGLLPSLPDPVDGSIEGGYAALQSPPAATDWGAVLNSLEVGVVVCDRDRTITAANLAARRLLLPPGGDQDWAKISTTADFYQPGNRTPLPPEQFPLWQILAGTSFSDLELAIAHPTGRRYIVLLSGHPLLGPGGQIVGASISLYDISHRYRSEVALRFKNQGLKTESQQRLEDLQATNQRLQQESAQLRRAKQALQESEHLFSTIANASPALVWMSDTDGRCVYFNKPWLDFRGHALEQELDDGWVEGVHPQDVDYCLSIYTSAFAARRPFSMEYRLRRHDGDYRWLLDSGQPRYATDGEFLGYIGTCLDISDRKQDEATLRLFYDLPFIGMAIISPTTRQWVQLNDRLCEILGYARQDLQHMTWTEITHPDDLKKDVEEFDRVMRGETQGYAVDKRFLRHDGNIVYATVNMKCIRKDNGQVDFFVATIQDITEAKRAAATLQQYTRRLQGLHQMDRAILTQFRPRDIARSALTLLCQLLDCDQGIVALLNEDAQSGFVIADNSGDNLLFPAGACLPLNDFVFFPASPQRPKIKRVCNLARLKRPPLIFQCFLAIKIRSAMAIPLVVDGRTIGEVILADPRVSHFQPDHDETAQEIANHLAIALQTASLLERVQQHRERLQALSSRMLETQETERRRLAHELHDEIGQALTAVKLNLHRLERLAELPAHHPVLADCLHITETALQQVRNLSLDLRPSMLDDLGLLPALRWYIHRHQERTGLTETLVCKTSLPALSTNLETACFRIVQEALTNIVRHAQATTVTVTLAATADTLELSIEDDGIGFDMQRVHQSIAQGSSLGLLGMQERGILADGQVTIASAPEQGTTIYLTAPLAAQAKGVPQHLQRGTMP